MALPERDIIVATFIGSVNRCGYIFLDFLRVLDTIVAWDARSCRTKRSRESRYVSGSGRLIVS